jgi:hypothetical protein
MLNSFLFGDLHSTLPAGLVIVQRLVEAGNGPMTKYFVHDMTTIKNFIDEVNTS